MVRFFGGLALLATPLGALSAQQIDFRTGTHVRVLSGSEHVPLVGKIIAHRADSLIVRDREGKTVSLALGSISQLQVGHRVQNGLATLAKSGAGLLIGAAAGALVGPLVTSGACRSSNKDLENVAGCGVALFDGKTRGRAALVGGLGGAFIGAVAGVVTGSERWEGVEIRRVQPMITLDHDGVGASLTLRF